MSDFHISIDPRAKLTPAQIEALTDIVRQCRSDDDIRNDNAEAQRDYDQERLEGWSVRR